MASYTFLGQFVSDPIVEKILVGVAVCVVLAGLGFLATKKIRTAEGIEDNLVPTKKFSITSLFDWFVEMFVNYYDSILGKNNRKHLTFCASVFFFLLFANLIGLVPGMATPTTTIPITVGLALVVFFYFNYVGISESGVWGYLKHFMGPLMFPVVLLAPLIFLIELISTLMRVLTLNLRLYWNIMADHTILGVATELLPYVSFPVYFLGTFVCVIQAFVFTTLTMIYILLASQHGEEDH